MLPGATDGDSMILAFHTAQDAVQFCLDAQRQLLAAPWPQALLARPEAGVVWVLLPSEMERAYAMAARGGGSAAVSWIMSWD